MKYSAEAPIQFGLFLIVSSAVLLAQAPDTDGAE